MEKDDYFVIVYKLLSYLYMQLKTGEDIDEKMISHESPILQINKRYWNYIMENLIIQICRLLSQKHHSLTMPIMSD